MYDVVTFGEAMVRLAPPNFQRLEQATSLDLCVGGGELNVAVSIARLGMKSAWVSRLPENPLGRMIQNKAREHGVCTDHVVWSKKVGHNQDRAGLYFMEFGATPRASSVLYDRAMSAISNVKPGEIDWDKVFEGSRWFHVSGITPGLSKSCIDVTMEALKAAKKNGLKTSYDLNYRGKLWTPEEAGKAQEPMMEFVDVLISNEKDLDTVFKIKIDSGKDFDKIEKDSFKEAARVAHERFNVECVLISLRRTISVLQNGWSGICYDGKKFYEDREYIVDIVDRVGGGDSFTAGFIFGCLEKDYEFGVKFGNAFSAIKHTIPGDLNWVTYDEVEKLMKGGGSMRIQR